MGDTEVLNHMLPLAATEASPLRQRVGDRAPGEDGTGLRSPVKTRSTFQPPRYRASSAHRFRLYLDYGSL